MRHIIQPALGNDYTAVRADQIAEPGIITNQVIQRIVNDPLVIADLTEQNPNVFYELAIRHISRKPFVQIVGKGHRIPFDVAETRTVFFDLTDPDSVADAREEVAKQIKHLEENPDDVQTPISVPLDLQRLRQGQNPDEQGFVDLLSVLSDISDTTNATRREMHNLSALSIRDRDMRSPRQEQLIRRVVSATNSPFAFLALISTHRWSMPWVYEFGMEAYRQAADGNSALAREILQEMENFAGFSGEFQRGFSTLHIGELSALLERFIEHYERRAYDIDDLPF